MVALTNGEILAGTLVQLFVKRVNRYVEQALILGLDATILDGVHQPWLVIVLIIVP